MISLAIWLYILLTETVRGDISYAVPQAENGGHASPALHRSTPVAVAM